MSQSTVRVFDAFKFGYHVIQKHFWFFVLLLLFVVGVSFCISWLQSNYQELEIVSWALTVVSYVVQVVLSIGVVKIILQFVDGGVGTWKDFDTALRYFWQYLLASILYSLIVLAGLLLFIVPGVIWALKYLFFDYLIVDQNMDALTALKESGVITKGHKGALLVLILSMIGLNILGVVALGIGLFVTMPITMLAMGYTYRTLHNQLLPTVIDEQTAV